LLATSGVILTFVCSAEMISKFSMIHSAEGQQKKRSPRKRLRNNRIKSAEEAYNLSNEPSLKVMDTMISNFRCGCNRYKNFAGGCYKKAFEHEDDYDYKNMNTVLLVYRKKTYLLKDDELETEALRIFNKHCVNISEVVDSTSNDLNDMFGSKHLTQSHSNDQDDRTDSLTDSVLTEYEKFRKSNFERMKSATKKKKNDTISSMEVKFKFDWTIQVSVMNEVDQPIKKMFKLVSKISLFLIWNKGKRYQKNF
jgi:hypothetical protein